MAVLLLCGLTEEETSAFLEAERSLIESLTAKEGLAEGSHVSTFRLKELPDPDDAERPNQLARDLLGVFGLANEPFQILFMTHNGYSFMAILAPGAAPAEAQEKPAAVEKQPKLSLPRIRWQIPAYIAGGIVLLAALYYGIGFYLTRRINTDYTNRDCESVREIAKPTEKFYPPSIAPFVLPALAQAGECNVYLTAVQCQEAGTWESALESYENYLADYPAGIYVTEARENASATLLAWAEEQFEDEKYDKAVDHLLTLLYKYPETASAATAKTLVPKYYVTWGKQLRANYDYLEAEEVLWDFQKWATQSGTEEDEKNANLELAWLYLQWARDLAYWEDYENAVSTYEMVLDLEPTPRLSNGPSSFALQELPPARVGWGDELIAQKKFEEAIEQYQTAISSTKQPATRSAIQDKIVRGYIKWADSLADSADFWGALKRIDTAESLAENEKTKQEVTAARTQTLEAFSKSQGRQAKAYMAEVAEALVEDAKVPELPIFGVNTESVRIYPLIGGDTHFHGAFGGIAEDILPPTPGEMHYVAYITEEERVIESCAYYYVSGGGYAGAIKRHRYYWKVKLIDLKNGKIVRYKEIAGPAPDICPYTTYVRIDIWGEPPNLADLEAWLRTIVK